MCTYVHRARERGREREGETERERERVREREREGKRERDKPPEQLLHKEIDVQRTKDRPKQLRKDITQ